MLRSAQSAKTPPELMEWLRRAVADRRPAPDIDVSWLTALPMLPTAGMRGAADGRLLACTLGDMQLLAQVHVEDNGAACAVTGKLLGPNGKPLAARSVAYLVDRRSRETVVTDVRGEFEFDEQPGSAFGVRVGDGADAVHVKLFDFAGPEDGLPADGTSENGPPENEHGLRR